MFPYVSSSSTRSVTYVSFVSFILDILSNFNDISLAVLSLLIAPSKFELFIVVPP